MNPTYHNLPETFCQALFDRFDEAEALGIDPKVLSALVFVPLVADHFTEAEQLVGQRLDTLRQACEKNACRVVRRLSEISFRLFVDSLSRFRRASAPWQVTRWRIVLCGDDSLLVHAEESNQPDIVNIFSTLYKTYRKAHDLIVLGVTVGAKEGQFFFPLWVQLWRQPGLRKQTRPQRMAAALRRLNQSLAPLGYSLDGIDFVADHGYLSPTVAQAVKECGLVFTTRLQSSQTVALLSGEEIKMSNLRQQLMQQPVRYDPRAGHQAYYWRCEAIHPYLGKGTLVIQRRKLRSGGFEYYCHFSQAQNAKAITVLQLSQRRWPIEVFFRESKQHLSLGHLPFRKWSALIGHIALRGLVYFLLAKVRRKLRWRKRDKTIGALKRRLRDTFLAIFRALFPLNAQCAAENPVLVCFCTKVNALGG